MPEKKPKLKLPGATLKLPKFSVKLQKLKIRRRVWQFFDFLKDYFIGLLLMPWIWIWGFLITISVFIWFYYSRVSADITRYGLPLVFNREVNLRVLWYQIIGFVFLNYTLSFFTESKYPKLKFFFVITSVLILFLLTFITWPHVQEVLRG